MDEYGEKQVLVRLAFPCVCPHTSAGCLVVGYGNRYFLIAEPVGIIEKIYVGGIDFLQMDDIHYSLFILLPRSWLFHSLPFSLFLILEV